MGNPRLDPNRPNTPFTVHSTAKKKNAHTRTTAPRFAWLGIKSLFGVDNEIEVRTPFLAHLGDGGRLKLGRGALQTRPCLPLRQHIEHGCGNSDLNLAFVSLWVANAIVLYERLVVRPQNLIQKWEIPL